MRRPREQQNEAWAGSSYSAGLAFSLASFGAVGFVALFTSVLSARLYGIAVVGQAALVLAPVTIVTLLSTVREQPSMVRELAKLRPRHPQVTGITLAVFMFSLSLTTAVTGLGIVGCYFAFHGPLHNPGLLTPAIVALAGYLVIINTCWNMDGVFAAFRAGRELFAVRLHQAVIYGVLLVVFFHITHSVWGLVWAFLGSWATALVHRLLLLRRVISWRVPLADIRAGFAILSTIVSFGLKMTPGFLSIGFSEASGTWILGATSSVSAVGAYSRAWTFATRLSELNWRITEMLLPTLVQRRHAGDAEGFDRVLRESLRYAAFGMLLPAAVGGGAASAIMHIFGSGFDAAATALRLLLFVPLLQTLIAIQGAALVAHGRPLLESFGQIVRLIVTVGGGIALTLAYGITGMAIALVAGALLSFAFLALVQFRSGMSMLGRPHFRQLTGFSAAYGSGFALSHILEHNLGGSLGLIVALIAGSLAYVIFGIGVSGLTSQDRARLGIVIKRLSKGRRSPIEIPGAA